MKLLMIACIVAGLISQSMALVSIQTIAPLPNPLPTTATTVHDFLATPVHWPMIVLSSWAVEGDSSAYLIKGRKVREVFGLPPLLPLTVDWTCIESQRGQRLELISPEGVTGIATDCRMLFEYSSGERMAIQLTFEYEPRNVLGYLAIPILYADNAIALHILLPNAMRSEPPSQLAEFRRLMGILYGIAGVAHLWDCLFGGSQLLTSTGMPVYYDLPILGQIYVCLWCGAGPFAYLSSVYGKRVADMGLLAYGAIEVVGVVLAGANPSPALLVQAMVGLAWLYSSQQLPKGESTT